MKADSCLENVTKEEYQGWKEHPCTQGLIYTLEAELDRVVVNFVKGGFNNNTVENTAMMQARATGISEAMESIITYIDDMLEVSQRVDNYEEDQYTP